MSKEQLDIEEEVNAIAERIEIAVRRYREERGGICNSLLLELSIRALEDVKNDLERDLDDIISESDEGDEAI